MALRRTIFGRPLVALATLLVGLAPGLARAAPDAIFGTPSLSGATLTAAYAEGTGLDTRVVLADQAGNTLRVLSVATQQELTGTGVPLALTANCGPRDLVAEGGYLFVACGGTAAAVDVVNISGLANSTPALVLTTSVSLGSAPTRLLQLQSGPLDYLIAMNAVAKTATVIDISTPTAPVIVDADGVVGAPVSAVRLCGTDPMESNRSTPVGLGAGTEHVWVACSDGLLSHFNPFAGGDFSQSTSENLGLVTMGTTLVDAMGRPGVHGFYVQLSSGKFSVVDVSQVESGGSPVLQVLYDDGMTAFTTVQGPTIPNGILPFTDSETGKNFLALAGAPSAAALHLFDVDDLAPAYTPPASRTAATTFTTGLAVFSGTNPLRPFFADGFLYLPSGGAPVTIFTGAPLLTFDAPAAPYILSGQSDPDMGECTPPTIPLDVTWTASDTVASCTAYLEKSSDSRYALSTCTTNGTDGSVPLDTPDVMDLSNKSEEVTLYVLPQDGGGNEAVFSETVLVDGIRPNVPPVVSGQIVSGQIYVSWFPAADPAGVDPASGVSSYVVKLTRYAGTGQEKTIVLPPMAVLSIQGTFNQFDDLADGGMANSSSERPVAANETIWVNVASCDAAGNHSGQYTADYALWTHALGAAGASGETGGCVLGGPGGGGMLLLALAYGILAVAALWERRRRRSVL